MTLTTHPRARVPVAAAGAVLLAVLTAGCGGSDSAAPDPTPTSSQTSSTPTSAAPTSAAPTSAPAAAEPDIDVTIAGDSVKPSGERIPVDIDQTVTIHVSSDRAGELHVHSTPEQELEYGKGETDLELTIDKPGVVDVEDHVADVIIAQLEVS